MNITPPGRVATPNPNGNVERLLKDQNQKLDDIYSVLARIASLIEERGV